MSKQRNLTKYIIVIFLTLVAGLVCNAHIVWGLDYYWGNHPDKERLVFEFSNDLPSYQIQRNSNNSINLSFPSNIWQNEKIPISKQVEEADLLQSVNIQGTNIQINTQTPEFGYTYFELPEQKKLVFDIFRDILGNSWKKDQSPNNVASNQEQQTTENTNKSTSNIARRKTQNEKTTKKNNQQTSNPNNNRSETEQTSLNATSDSLENNKLKQPINRSILSSSKSNRSTHTFISSINKTLIEPQPESKEEINNQTETNRTLTAKANNKTKNRSSSTENKSIEIDKKSLTDKQIKDGINATNASILKAKFDTAKLALSQGKPKTAKKLFEEVIENPEITQKQKEEALYHLADANFQLYGDNAQEHYSKLVNSLKRAINFDPDSPRVPQSILRLLLTNLRAGNIPEAKGYFNYLMENHPDSEHIPTARLYLGNYYLKDSQFDKAVEQFQKIIEDHPQYSNIKMAALNLLKAFKEMELYEKGRKIAEYINNRWPKIYLKNPEFLKLAGLVNFKTNNYKKAKDLYWKYYNLNPESPDADIILTRIGDTYLQTENKDQAKKMYQEVASKYPQQDGGLISKMRLAEEGVYDKPKIKRMFSVFNRPFNLKPLEVYKEIVQKHPNNSLAPLAQLKMAMWYLWRDKYQKALSKILEFENKFPQSELKKRSREVGKKAIQNLVNRAVNDQDFQNAINLWKKHDYLHKGEQETDPKLNLAIALSYWKTGNRDKAIKMASPYLNKDNFTQHSESALELVLNIYVNNQSWQDILELSEDIKAQQLSPKLRAQYKYARALAHENQGNFAQSKPLWEQLATNKNLSEEQSGYAYYFLARNTQRNDKREKTYDFAQQSLSSLLNTNPEQNKGKISDCYDMLIKVTKQTGRIMEALEWAQRYGDFLSEESSNWPEYRYKLANLYQQAGDKERWKQVLKQLSKNHPQTYYGQMADADLSSSEINKQANSFLD